MDFIQDADAGFPSKVRLIVQAIFTAATGVVRVRQPNGKMAMSEPFNIERGVLQGDMFSPVSFIAGLDRIFRRHDISNSGVTVGAGENAVCLSKLEYADDAALIDENVERTISSPEKEKSDAHSQEDKSECDHRSRCRFTQFVTQMQRMRSRVYKAARPDNPHSQMV